MEVGQDGVGMGLRRCQKRSWRAKGRIWRVKGGRRKDEKNNDEKRFEGWGGGTGVVEAWAPGGWIKGGTRQEEPP